MSKVRRILSLGAGIQSTDLLLRSLRGEYDHVPECAVFSDTGCEPAAVYKYLEWLSRYVEKEYHFQVKVISAGNLYSQVIDFCKGDVTRTDGLPLYIKNKDGSMAMLKRECTGFYKIVPIRRYIKEGLPKGGRVELWLGISYDELQRMKNADARWVIHRFPLIEKRLTRYHCIENFKKYELPTPVRSSCIICPYHSNGYWHSLYTGEPESFEAAVALDEMVRHYPGITDAECYLHRSGRPLKEVIMDIIKGKEQAARQLELFPELIEECGGLCGT